MRCFPFFLAGMFSALAASPPSQAAPDDALMQLRAAALARQLREAMTAPALMRLPFDAERAAASGGLRGLRQREAARPWIRQLTLCGKAAAEPLRQLIDDADESVRLSCVILLGEVRTDAAGKPIASQTLIDLNFPLLERALASKDAKVRRFAAGGLADFADWSDECLERLRSSLPKLRELRSDSDKEVRLIGWTACDGILAKLATRAKKPEDRKTAEDERKQLQQEKW